MNRKSTWIMALVVAFLFIVILVTERDRTSSRERRASGGGAFVLRQDPESIQMIRIKRDYWNTVTLERTADGQWQLTEPMNEQANVASVRALLEAVTTLPVVERIDVPAADESERYREYGLWDPVVEVTVSDLRGATSLVFGRDVPDGGGVYCAVVGRDGIYITTLESLNAMISDAEHYRRVGMGERR